MEITEEKLPKALIVLNPVSGRKSWKARLAEIEEHAQGLLDYEIFVWEHFEQFELIEEKIRRGNYHYAIAAGGDGTVNMMANAVLYSDTILGIIPMGSGNGIARHLKIPLQTGPALSLVTKGEPIKMDCGWINGKRFVCTAGAGFDAHIGKLFAESNTRGFMTYFKTVVSELWNFRPQEYTLFVNEQRLSTKAFLITFANASQYGNNAYIAPNASICDGKLDICILKPFKLYHLPGLALRLFTGKLPGSRLYERILTDEAERKPALCIMMANHVKWVHSFSLKYYQNP